MANPEHLSLIREGVEAWNQWRINNYDLCPDLSGETFVAENLQEVNFFKTNLSGAYFYKANLNKAKLNIANLNASEIIDTDLRYAQLYGASLSGTKLSGADLLGADLSEAHFYNSELTRTNFSNARLIWTVFGNVDLSQSIGLQNIYHEGPSTIGMESIYKSAGNVPEEFLRGCGLSDLQFKMVELHKRGLTEEQTTNLLYDIHQLIVLGAIHSHSSFISYSTEDQAFTNKIYNDLQNNGVRCWLAKEHMPIGGKLRDEIDKAISLQENVLLILSENGIDSNWVEDEVERALEVEKERGKRILITIRLDDSVLSTGKAWARKVRRRLVGDFRNWKNETDYQAEFNKLLRGIKAMAEGEF